MSPLRIAAGFGVAAGLTLLIASPACSVDSVGVEECRDLEYARCEASNACGVVTDVAACKRFYRDHCLHGFALSDPPSTGDLRACINSIKAISACASDPALGKDTLLTACPNATIGPSVLTKACDAVDAPEDLYECEFLIPEPPPPPPPDAGSDQTDAPVAD